MGVTGVIDKKVIILLMLSAIVACVMAVFTLPTGALDARLYYDFAEAKEYLSRLSGLELQHYLLNEILDVLFLVFYSSASVVVMMRLYSGIDAILFALAPGFLDLIETGTIISLLVDGKFQDVPVWLGVVTSLKWISALVLIVLILNGFRKKI